MTTERKLWRCVERLDLYGFERDGDVADARILSGKEAEGSGVREIGCQRDRAEQWGVSGGPEQAFAWATG